MNKVLAVATVLMLAAASVTVAGDAPTRDSRQGVPIASTQPQTGGAKAIGLRLDSALVGTWSICVRFNSADGDKDPEFAPFAKVSLSFAPDGGVAMEVSPHTTPGCSGPAVRRFVKRGHFEVPAPGKLDLRIETLWCALVSSEDVQRARELKLFGIEDWELGKLREITGRDQEMGTPDGPMAMNYAIRGNQLLTEAAASNHDGSSSENRPVRLDDTNVFTRE